METKYSGYTIKYNEQENRFECVVDKIDGEVVEPQTIYADTLSKMKARLDKVGEPTTNKQPKQKCLEVCIGKDDKFVVSPVSVGTFGKVHSYSIRIYAWVTSIGYRGREERNRVDTSSSWNFKFYKDTEKVRGMLQEIADLRNAVKDLEKINNKKVYTLEKKLESHKVKPLIKDEDLPVWDK